MTMTAAATARTLWATLLAGALLLGGSMSRAAQTAPDVVRVVIGGADQPEELHRRIRNLIGPPWDVRFEIATTPEIASADLFGPGDGSGAPAAVWVLVGDGAARIRAADGRRQLFVFRDVAVAAPLAELDRERIAQVANAALATVLDRRPGALDRAAAARLLGVEPPRPPPTPVPPAPAIVATSPAPAAVPATSPQSWWTVGASYEVQASGRALFQGPGGTVGLRVRDGAITVAMQGQAYFPVVLQEGTLYQYVLRLLVTLPFGRWVQAGVGGGLEYTGGEGAFGAHSVTMPSGRLLVRGGPVTLAGLRLSGTFSVDVDESLNGLWGWYQALPWQVRPSVALELWWH
jgi:hypothetical protein